MMKHRNWKKRLATAALTVTMLVTPAFATGGIADSEIGQGIKNLIQDLTIYIGIIGPLGASGFAGWFALRRAGADPQDAPMWEKRIKAALVCAVAIPLMAGIVHLIASYF